MAGNSDPIIRKKCQYSYINECKGQISQEHLNLIMFYHNYHQYKSGKRKAKAPIELLMKMKLEKDWLELLFETISQTN